MQLFTVCQALFLVCELAPAPPVSQVDVIIIVPIVDMGKPRPREIFHTKARFIVRALGLSTTMRTASVQICIRGVLPVSWQSSHLFPLHPLPGHLHFTLPQPLWLQPSPGIQMWCLKPRSPLMRADMFM